MIVFFGFVVLGGLLFFYNNAFKLNVITVIMISKCLEVEEEKLRGLDKEEPEELERVTYGNTTFRLLKIGGNYQIEKGNRQEVVNLIDYTRLGISVEGLYNAEIENAFIRIKKARGHSNRFYREKKELDLRVDDSDLVGLNNGGEPDHPTLDKAITSVLGKPMKFTIFPSRELRSHLDFLTIDETV